MTKPAIKHPYRAGHDQFFAAKLRFETFQAGAQGFLKPMVEAMSRGKIMADVHSLYVQPFPGTVQVWFGRRAVPDRSTPDGTLPVEEGAKLVYSLGPTGYVAVLLYPATSDLHGALESNLRLDLGKMSVSGLKKASRGYLRDLVAYQYATALDGQPTRLERLRVWWLRTTHTTEVDGVRKIRGNPVLGWLAQRFVQAGFLALLKPVGILLVLALLTWWGWAPALKLFDHVFHH